MKEIQSSNTSELQIIVTGTHLSPEFGETYREIEKDGFFINKKVEILLASDSPVGISKSMGLAMIGFSDAYANLNPDIIVVLGDRFEIFAAASAATVARIPIAHLSGGETTEGAFDEAFRHSITKMSHLHFVSTKKYKERVIQLGEQPDRVFDVGAFGIDNIRNLQLLTKGDLEKSLDFKFGQRNLLITFHPVTLENSTSKQQFSNLLSVLEKLKNTHLIFTQANADTDGRIINQMIIKYVSSNSNKAVFYKSLGQLRYLSTLQYMDGVVGNSSSGLVEAPSFKIGTINIGDRQLGRVKSESVIDCDSSIKGIQGAFNTLFGEEFKKLVSNVENPYDKGKVADKISRVIQTHSLDDILKKKFYDIETLM
jgi:GDP/UDP-N,N'-diacetylbacillosamine 2-epimerase (hydrolysing)